MPRRNARPAIDAREHLDWAAGVGDGVARSYGFGRDSQERADLDQVAMLTVVRMAERFDISRVPPGGDRGGAFRGWAAINVRKECIREARRLKSGGTYHTRRELRGVAMVATPFSDLDRPSLRFDVSRDPPASVPKLPPDASQAARDEWLLWGPSEVA